MEEKRKIIKTFEGGYNRVGKIWCEKNKCDICGKTKICICSDGSEDEYGYAAICPKCVTQACEEYDKY